MDADRMEKRSQGSLVWSNVMMEDAGDYICKLCRQDAHGRPLCDQKSASVVLITLMLTKLKGILQNSHINVFV